MRKNKNEIEERLKTVELKVKQIACKHSYNDMTIIKSYHQIYHEATETESEEFIDGWCIKVTKTCCYCNLKVVKNNYVLEEDKLNQAHNLLKE